MTQFYQFLRACKVFLVLELKMHFCFTLHEGFFNVKKKSLFVFYISLFDFPNELQGTFNVLGDSYQVTYHVLNFPDELIIKIKTPAFLSGI